MNTVENRALFWHRRDLRILDNAALYKALKNYKEVYSVFIFDTTILSKLEKEDQRVLFIYQEIARLKLAYQGLGSDLDVYFGDPQKIILELALKLNVSVVYANNDYEPNAIKRDKFIYEQLMQVGISFVGAKDHVVFEKNEVLKADLSAYTVFTPYKNRWLAQLNAFYLKAYPVERYYSNLAKKVEFSELIPYENLGFVDRKLVNFPLRNSNPDCLMEYSQKRDFPSLDATSRLSLHLRFGTISIRELARNAALKSDVYLSELIWRDFYQMIIYHFPDSESSAFKKKYNFVAWDNNETHFALWCEGKTGYPIVDAGMRELNATGFMHNRVRMIVASFLTKHLLIDWKWGETYFAKKLLDYELASNVGGWQWAASSGCDASPYFRVFNPTLQQQKFDKHFTYIKKWIPEFETDMYPAPIVDHVFARERVLSVYKNL